MANDFNYYPYGYGGYGGYGGMGGSGGTNMYNPYGFGNYNPYSTWGPYANASMSGQDSSIYFPTGTEATTWAASIPGFQQQANLLGGMSSPQGFQSAMQPYINQMMTQLGRSGLPSSSYADRMISDVLGNVYAQNALNTASGWGNYMTAMAPWAGGYAQYPMSVSQLLQG